MKMYLVRLSILLAFVVALVPAGCNNNPAADAAKVGKLEKDKTPDQPPGPPPLPKTPPKDAPTK